MKICKAQGDNFQSYKHVEFNYEDLGLTLIEGPTGTGKSTLLDLPLWCLYGVTSKEGAADDVKSWDSSSLTQAWVTVDTPRGIIDVVRVRGKSSDNDLYFIEYGTELECRPPSDPIRGKDITDTQKLIDKRLGIGSDLFLMSSYMTQFSKADTFFIAKAKDRREVLEKIADQEFAIALGVKSSEERKLVKKRLESLEMESARITGSLTAARDNRNSLLKHSQYWAIGNDDKLEQLRNKYKTFEADKDSYLKKLQEQYDVIYSTIKPLGFNASRIQDLKDAIARLPGVRKDHGKVHREIVFMEDKYERLQVFIEHLDSKDVCPTCQRTSLSEVDRVAKIEETRVECKSIAEELQAKVRALTMIDNTLEKEQSWREELDKLIDEESQNERNIINLGNIEEDKGILLVSHNPYKEQAEACEKEINPFVDTLASCDVKIADCEKMQNVCFSAIREVKAILDSITWLYDKSFELRGLMMEKVVNIVEEQTNKYLEKFFDASLRINLSLQGSDKLEISILNNGHECSFRQLSGGERCILKLAFSLSLMKAAQNKSGISFGMVMLDEALNGLDDGLKVKAFSLLQHLESDFPTVLLIDHCEEFKSLFTNKFVVAKENDLSTIRSNE